ncbi:hypothetical protein [Dermabacter vaginalis]|uniref:Uracil-DNA glycosylase-like domain-containing protein n=1 Tax=Dermabacter vaginalis TaxID=1630135 RepID=A0ABX6A1E3_9MICO|nr:hypothetical protein [Dermabacter vaginalis]QEU10978.1 hypothetical protein FOB48_00730 [Dermabacter vaginalis]
MDYQIFDLMRTRYGLCGSWTVWIESPWSPDSIRAPLLRLDSVVRTFGEVRSQQQLDTELPSLRTDLVLVALNFAERAAGITAVTDRLSFASFHEECGRTSDRRLRDACKANGLEGAYITDLVKMQGGKVAPFRSSKSMPINTLLRDPRFVREQVDGLCEELQTLGSRNPLIVGLGAQVYKALYAPASLDKLRETCGNGTQVARITHYSSMTGMALPTYISRVGQELADFRDYL